MTFRRLKILFLLFVFGTCSVWCVVWFIGKPIPSDEQLLQNYLVHKNEFNDLAQMLVAEKEIRIVSLAGSHCQTASDKIVTATQSVKCADYVQRLKELGITGQTFSGHESLDFKVYYEGMVGAWIEKGYVYRRSAPALLVSSTDDFQGKKLPLYRKIDENWYIYFDGE